MSFYATPSKADSGRMICSRRHQALSTAPQRIPVFATSVGAGTLEVSGVARQVKVEIQCAL